MSNSVYTHGMVPIQKDWQEVEQELDTCSIHDHPATLSQVRISQVTTQIFLVTSKPELRSIFKNGNGIQG